MLSVSYHIAALCYYFNIICVLCTLYIFPIIVTNEAQGYYRYC